MNFFYQDDNIEESNQEKFNFLDSNQLSFNFNEDTFAPEEMSSYQNNFAPINIKDFNQSSINFNFSQNSHPHNHSQQTSGPSQSSFIKKLFDPETQSENKNSNEITLKNDNKFLPHQSKPSAQQITNKIVNYKPNEKNSIPSNELREIDLNIDKTISNNKQNNKILNVNNALLEVEKLMNLKPSNQTSNYSSVANQSIKDVENLLNIKHKNQNQLSFPNNIDTKSNYFNFNSNEDHSNSEEEEASRKRKIEKKLDKEKKCPKIDNKLYEMNFFDNQTEKFPNNNLEVVMPNKNQRIFNDANKPYIQNSNEISGSIINNVNSNYSKEQSNSNNLCSTKNVNNSSFIKPINNANLKTTGLNNMISISNKNINTNIGIKNSQSGKVSNKFQQKRNSNPNSNSRQYKANHKVTKMPSIQEEMEEKENEIDYYEKLQNFKENFKILDSQTSNIKGNLMICLSVYEILNNYINQSENFKIQFRTIFKRFLNNYQELIIFYSHLFIQLNISNKIEKRTDEFNNIFKLLKDKLNFGC